MTTTGDGVLPLDERIARVEAAYQEAGQAPLFRIPDFTDEAVTAALNARGYEPPFRHSCVLASNDPARSDEPSVQIHHDPTCDWLDAHAQADGVGIEQRAMHDDLFRRTPAPRLFASVLDGSHVVAVAMTVLIGDLAVVQGVGTLEAARRRGYGRRVMRALLAEAWRQGTRSTVLQVGANNDAAQPMYMSLNFERIYQYAYRRRASA